MDKSGRTRRKAEGSYAEPSRAQPVRNSAASTAPFPDFDGETSLQDAIRLHKRAEDPPPPPLARQRSRVLSGGRAWERTASGRTNAATDGGDDNSVGIYASPRIAVRGPKRSRREGAGNGGGGGGGTGRAGSSKREIPRMPSFGGAAARHGRIRGGVAGAGGRRTGSKLSNAVDLGSLAKADKGKQSPPPPAPLEISPHATTWQGFVETVSASVFDTPNHSFSQYCKHHAPSFGSAATSPSAAVDSPTTTASDATAASAAEQLLLERISSKQPVVGASELIAASARRFITTPPDTRDPPRRDGSTTTGRSSQSDMDVLFSVKPCCAAPAAVPPENAWDNRRHEAYEGVPERVEAETEAQTEVEAAAGTDSEARVVAAEVSAGGALVVVAERTRRNEEPEAEREQQLVALPGDGGGDAPGAATVTASEQEAVKIVAADDKPLLAPSDVNGEWQGISVRSMAKRFEQQQQQQQQQQRVDDGGVEPGPASSRQKSPDPDAAGRGTDSDEGGDRLPESTENAPSARKLLHTAGNEEKDDACADGSNDGRVWGIRSRGNLNTQTSINSLVRDALELADAIERGWSGEEGEDWGWRHGLTQPQQQQQQQQQQRRRRCPEFPPSHSRATAEEAQKAGVAVQADVVVDARDQVFDSASGSVFASAEGRGGTTNEDLAPPPAAAGQAEQKATVVNLCPSGGPPARSVDPSPPLPPPPPSDGGQLPPEGKEGAVVGASVSRGRPTSLPASRYLMMANSRTFEPQTGRVGMMANSPNFEPIGGAPVRGGDGHVDRTRQTPAASPAALVMANTPPPRDEKGEVDEETRQRRQQQGQEEASFSHSRPDGGIGRQPRPLSLPVQRSQPASGQPFVFAVTATDAAKASNRPPLGGGGSGDSVVPMMSNTPTSDLGKTRHLTSLLSPSSAKSPSGLPPTAAPLQASLAATAPWTAAVAAPALYHNDIDGDCVSDTSKALLDRAPSGMSASAAAAAAAAAATAAALENAAKNAAATADDVFEICTHSQSFSTAAPVAAAATGGGESASGGLAVSGSGDDSVAGDDTPGVEEAREPTAEEWEHQLNEERAEDESQEEASTVVASDGGGRFPFLARDGHDSEGTEGGNTNGDATTTTTTSTTWLGRGNQSLFMSTRWSTGSGSSFESNNRGGGGGGGGGDRGISSPRSRLREATLRAPVWPSVAAAAASGSRDSGVACRVPLRCAGSGADLASRVREFLASERKVRGAKGKRSAFMRVCVPAFLARDRSGRRSWCEDGSFSSYKLRRAAAKVLGVRP